MRLLLRLMAIFTALSVASSSTLSAMPLVWCIGNDGHRAVETMLHQQGVHAAEASVDDGIDDPSHHGPCSDWRLLSTAGPPQAKSLDAEPKAVTVVVAYPPLKQAVGLLSPTQGLHAALGFRPTPAAHLSAHRSVVLRI
jgi:hypothetical protein